MRSYLNLSSIILLSLYIIVISPATKLKAQELPTTEAENKSEKTEPEKTLDASDISLEELLNTDIKVEVGSLFIEDDLLIGSTVAKITPAVWNRQGAKRTGEALNSQLGIVNYIALGQVYNPRIRGLSGAVSLQLDGVPMIAFSYGRYDEVIPNWNLGTLNSIETIKGPGSALYGSDAFNGVISMRTFESDLDHYSIQLGGGYSLFYDGDIKISHGLYEDTIRFDLSACASGQGDKKIEEKYDDDVGFPPPDYGLPNILPPASATFEREDVYNSQSSTLKATIKPFDKLKIRLGGYLNRFDSNGGFGSYYYPLPIYLRDSVTDRDSLFKMGKVSVSLDLPEKIEVEVNGFYWESEMTEIAVLGKYMQDATYLITISEPIYTGGEIVRATEFYESVMNRRLGANLVIKQPDNIFNLQWVLGYSFTYMDVPETEFKVKDKITGNYFPFRFSEGADPGKFAFEDESRKINSVFAQLRWGVIKKSLYLLAGGRYDHYPSFGGQFTPRGGIIFLPTEKSSIKALYGRAFKAPSAADLTATAFDLGNEDLKPETIDSFELIYIHKGDDWRLDVIGYFSYWKEGIQAVVNPDTSSPYGNIIENGAKQRAYGGEIRGNYLISPFSFDLGFAYSKSEKLDIPDPDDPTRTTEKGILTYPTYTILAGVYYSLKSLGVDFFLNNKIYLDWQQNDNEDSDKMPLFYRLDFNTTKNVADKLSISLNINNILNRENANPSANPDGTVNEPGIFALLRVNYKL